MIILYFIQQFNPNPKISYGRIGGQLDMFELDIELIQSPSLTVTRVNLQICVLNLLKLIHLKKQSPSA